MVSILKIGMKTPSGIGIQKPNKRSQEMNDVLLKTKRKISGRYLGKCGIHGVSINADENSIRVYVGNRARFIKCGFDKRVKADIGDNEIGLIIEECKKANIKNVLDSSFASAPYYDDMS